MRFLEAALEKQKRLTSELEKKLEEKSRKLDQELRTTVPFGQFEFVDVTFHSTAHKDTEIRHDLVAPDPEAIRVIPVEWKFSSVPTDPGLIYRDTSIGHRPWGQGYIILRSNVAAAQVRLLLVVEAR